MISFITCDDKQEETNTENKEENDSEEGEEEENVDKIDLKNFRHVESLDELTFNPFVKKHDIALVYFYITGCQACAEFQSHFNSVAESIKTNSKEGVNIAFGKVNAKEQDKLTEKYEIRRYPAMVIFTSKDPEKYDFHYGEYKRIPIERKVRAMIDSVTIGIKDNEHLEDLREFHDEMIIYVGKNEGDNYKKFVDEVKKSKYDDMFLTHCSFDECKSELGAEEGDVVVLKSFEEGKNVLKSGFSSEKLEEFISLKYFPDVYEFNEITYFLTFERKLPFLYFFRDASKKEEAEKYHKILKNIAPKIKRKVKVTELDIVAPIEKIIVEHFEINTSALPLILIFEAGAVRVLKYKFKGAEINEENLLQFVNDYLDKKLDPEIKSEATELSVIDEHDVKYVVGSEFEEFVNDPTKDVILMFYIDECVHCQDHYPTFNALAKALTAANPDNVKFGKFNYSKNETKLIYTDKYPGIFIWPSENKKGYTEFNNQEINKDNLINFFTTHASNPIHVVKDDL